MNRPTDLALGHQPSMSADKNNTQFTAPSSRVYQNVAKQPARRLLIEIPEVQHHNTENMEPLTRKIEYMGILTGNVLWPAIILFFCILFRKQLMKAISSLTTSNHLAQSDEPLEKNGHDTENDQTQPQTPGIDPELLKLTEVYSNLDLQNQVESIRTKDAIARDMADLVIRKKISRDTLVEAQNEGILLALAATIRTQPEPGDADRLLRVANTAKEHHVKYRVALAFGMLLARKLVSSSQVTQINEIMTKYEPNADATLQHRLQHTQKMISLYDQQLES